MSGNRSGWIVNGVSAAIGGGLVFWAWSGITAPAVTPLLGGRRRY